MPYRGSAPAINDLLAGNINIVPDYLLANKQNIDAGKLKVLGTGGRERLKDYGNVATLAETLPASTPTPGWASRVPAGKPQRSHEENIRRHRTGIPASPTCSARILALEAEPLGSTPDADARHDHGRASSTWGPVVEAAKISVE